MSGEVWMIIHIDSVDSLQQVAAYCHDALFNADEVNYDQGGFDADADTILVREIRKGMECVVSA
jgi:hypothetical protein